MRVLGFGCGADYLEGPVSSTPPEFAVPQARLLLRAACRMGIQKALTTSVQPM